ncbi:MAG: hypothetical protein IJZ09_04250 [Tidjanibacter sp.]|nr:hypothetical protein [Tidjanibacter sp.]
MSEIRIKELASAAGQLDKFDEFEFIVDVPAAEASMKIKGKELQERVAPSAHTHQIGEVQGLQSSLDKKLNKTGGVVSGDFSVEGNAYLRNLRLEEFLEVPEFRYNRVETSVGDEWSAPGAGIIELVDRETCRLVIKLEVGEISSLRSNDLCMGIFKNAEVGNYTEPTIDSDDSFGTRTFAGFTTCYFRLVECLNTSTYGEWQYELREGFPYHPAEAMNIVAFGNTTDTTRQTSRYATRTYERYLVGMNSWRIDVKNIAAQFGDLSNLSAHGLNMRGYSAYLKNIYLQGYISDALGDSWFDSVSGNAQLYDRSTGCGISFKDGVLRFGRIDPTNPEEGTDLDTMLEDIASTKLSLQQMNSDSVISPIEKTYLRERLSDIRAEYEELLSDAERYIVAEYLRVANGVVRTAGGKPRKVSKKNDAWDAYVNAYILAVSALEKYTAATPEYIEIEDDFAHIGAYYEARATIAKALSQVAATSTDLDYLRDNFQNSTTDVDGQSGVVLSGFVGVKDEGNEKVVAGMAGCDLSGTTDPKHGKLMFFAGADGIENAGSATTRIYEDGHVEMGTGVFGGYVKVPFKSLMDEGTDWDTVNEEYTVNKNLNLISSGKTKGVGTYTIWLNLPTTPEYAGSVLTIFDNPMRSRSAPSLVVAVKNEKSGILTPISKDSSGTGYSPVNQLIMHAGMLQLIAVPITSSLCYWMETYNTMLYYQKNNT